MHTWLSYYVNQEQCNLFSEKDLKNSPWLSETGVINRQKEVKSVLLMYEILPIVTGSQAVYTSNCHLVTSSLSVQPGGCCLVIHPFWHARVEMCITQHALQNSD